MKTARPYIHPTVAAELAAIDWILTRLVVMLAVYPERAADLAWRIDNALDERLRLMRVRDQHGEVILRSRNGSLTYTASTK
jgi:hypothetical protein